MILSCLPSSAALPKRPKMVVVIVIDQFRYDYLNRFRAEYHGGLARLLDQGSVFTNARYDQFPTVTAVGHSIIMTGADPAVSGIVGNSWYSREERRMVTSVCDDSQETIGTAVPAPKHASSDDCTDASPASPNRLLVDTVGDELRAVSNESRVIGISLKPRSAILPAGHSATGAYWFDESGVFVTSSFYAKELPEWAATFNAGRPADRYAGGEWMGNRFPTAGADLYRAIPASPWGNELIEQFAESAIRGERLGQRGVTDLLTISFSSNDYVGHRVGPDDPAVRDMAIRTDQLVNRLFEFIAGQGIGMQNVVFVLSADHGVVPLPETSLERKIPAGRMSPGQLSVAVKQALAAKFGPGEWLIEKPVEHVLYLNRDLIQARHLESAEVERVAAAALLAKPYVFRVYTRTQLSNGITGDRIARAVQNGFNMKRGGDVFVLLDPGWIFSMGGTNHGTPFNYDTHVPVIFMGPGIRTGRFDGNVSVTDVAPTLATMLGVEMPSGSEGRTLFEIFQEN